MTLHSSKYLLQVKDNPYGDPEIFVQIAPIPDPRISIRRISNNSFYIDTTAPFDEMKNLITGQYLDLRFIFSKVDQGAVYSTENTAMNPSSE